MRQNEALSGSGLRLHEKPSTGLVSIYLTDDNGHLRDQWNSGGEFMNSRAQLWLPAACSTIRS